MTRPLVLVALLVAVSSGLAAQKSAPPPVPAPAAAAVAAQPSALRVRYVANAGVLLNIDGQEVLIDAPIRDGISPYATPSADERQRLERAEAPFDNVSVILVTHWHEDHFSPEAVAAHLIANRRAVLVSSEEIVARVRPLAGGVEPRRLRGVTPAQGEALPAAVGALKIDVLRVRHNPVRRWPDQHVAFLIQGRSGTVLHVGDADPKTADFDVLRKLGPVDLALVPFWYVTDTGTWESTVQRTIKPRRVAAMHIPPQDAASVERQVRQAGRDVVVLVTPGAVHDVSGAAASPPRFRAPLRP
jgi:L-ascorbate metabolism protein UlaG (beta-lactamase superfamily)